MLNFITNQPKQRNIIKQTERLQAAAELSDRLEFGDWDNEEYAQILEKVAKVAAQEQDNEIRETLLNGMANALSQRDCHRQLNLEPLVEIISKVEGDCLLHIIDILGLSRNIVYAPSLKLLLQHSNPEIRENAAIALREMGD
ncbi:hypothetical protein [Oscillatoria salina]|uniref:hypothetical protein n=1 Tax=Oscillatoria salina TaxID=331517 RepID=UPI0013BCD1CD|nr:hypothetical protein [Oscillatoria salina]MBZ8183296.1 hypothetical protein [Oscillatoria salina IIICB1]NET87103.1 hypothetical protein [Kamptonema sp. SIO1D9]